MTKIIKFPTRRKKTVNKIIFFCKDIHKNVFLNWYIRRHFFLYTNFKNKEAERHEEYKHVVKTLKFYETDC